MEKLITFSQKKISEVSLEFTRYLYKELNEVDEKIVWIAGLRWIWKTFLLLQLAKTRKNSLYFSCDSSFFQWKKIFDLVEEWYNNFGFRNFFIDEIHKYKNWEQDLKTIYDFYDDIKVYFSWSSSIDLIKWNYDLSRRWLLFHLHKFSFREFLKFVYNIEISQYNISEILENSSKISLEIYEKEKNILKFFKEYLEFWELGFIKNTQKKYFVEKLQNVLNKIIYEDISQYYSLNSQNIYYFFHILKFIANAWPSILNYTSIAKSLLTTPDTIKYYIEILQEIGVLHIVWKDWNISSNLRKSKKALFELSNVAQILFDSQDVNFSIWVLRESFVVSELSKEWEIFYSEIWDYIFSYLWKDYVFEIWGKNKTYKQIKWVENSFLIKDDILIWEKNVLPLWILGFLY